MKRRNEGKINGAAVKATCPEDVCSSGAREVTFTAEAGTIDLKPVDGDLCESLSAVNQRTAAMRVGAYNTVTKSFVYKEIYNTRLSFTFPSDITISSFPYNEPLNHRRIKKPFDFRSFSPGPLRMAGTYAFQVSCPNCPGNKTVVCRSYVRSTHVPAAPPQAYTANPYDRDPLTNRPYTPVVRIASVTTGNGGASFTTHEAENLVEFRAQVLPEDFAEQSVITWNVIDDPTDGYTSALPGQDPVSDPGDKFRAMYRVSLGNEPNGRPAPLRYLVTAKAVVEDPVWDPILGTQEALSPYTRLKQDEIDKCRQEYVDFGISLADVQKSTFTIGSHREYGQSVWDCFAYIFPHQKAEEVQRLRQTYSVRVTAGYRSPRANRFRARSKAITTSEHMFGRAVDIQPGGIGGYDAANGHLIRPLWLEANCPKILERRTTTTSSAGQEEAFYQPILLGRCGANEGLPDWNGNRIEGEFTSRYLSEGERNILGNPKVFDILEDLMPPTTTNGIADIFDISRVIHLGD